MNSWKTSLMGAVLALAAGIYAVFPTTIYGQIAQVVMVMAGALGLHLAADNKPKE